MNTHRIHVVSRWTLHALAAIALLDVLTGFGRPPEADEGTPAHVFQLAIVLLAPVGALCLATATGSWVRRLGALVMPTLLAILAFLALAVLEHRL